MSRWDEVGATHEVSRRDPHQIDVKQRSVNRRALRAEDSLFTYDDTTYTPVGDRFLLQGQGSWDDLRFPATAINPPGAVSDPEWDVSDGGWLFDAGSTEVLYLIAQLPHSWVEGSTLKPHIHWEKSTSASGNVLWQLRYEWAPAGEARSTIVAINSSTAVVSDADTANTHAITSLGDIDATGRQISDILVMRVERAGGNAADTYGADARLLEFDIHYQVNTLGSREEFVK